MFTGYTAYEHRKADTFAGDCQETVIVSNKTMTVRAHFRNWDNASVVENWHPLQDGLSGTNWKDRPKGWRKCRYQEQVLDWAVEAMADWK